MKRTAPLVLAILLSIAGTSAMAGERYDRHAFLDPGHRAKDIHDWRSLQERRDRNMRRDWHERFGRYERDERRRIVLRPQYGADRHGDVRDGRNARRHPDYWR